MSIIINTSLGYFGSLSLPALLASQLSSKGGRRLEEADRPFTAHDMNTSIDTQYLVDDASVALSYHARANDNRQVTIISGGGSGHEPAFAGYVGDGMITASVCGGVFASPSSSHVLAAIRAACGPRGCLVLVMNYTGDRLNFGIAVEHAKVEGYNVSSGV